MQRIALGSAVYNPQTRELVDTNGADIDLRPKAHDVLFALAQTPGAVVSREALLETVWRDVVVTDDSLVQCISEIRRCIHDVDRTIVKTISKRGYALQVDLVSDGTVMTHAEAVVGVSSYLGREKEQHDVLQMLNQTDCRLLVIQGLGGVGKTSLIKSILPEVTERFADGGFFVSLIGVTDASLIPESVATAIGLTLQGALPPVEQIAIFLHGKKVLVALDNFDGFIDGAEVLQYLVAQLPGLKLLVGSRQPLKVPEAWSYNLAGFQLPENPADLKESVPYLFFLRTAVRNNSTFAPTVADDETILTIIRLVGGLPLGIEVVAGWLQHLTCDEALDELQRQLQSMPQHSDKNNEQEQEGNLAVVLQHSWQLCTPREQEILMSLSMLQGSFSRAVASEITDIQLSDYSSLIGKSMIHRNPDGRYALHEAIRQYAANQITVPETRVTERYMSYFLKRVQDCDNRILDGEQLESMTELKSIQNDVRTCLDICERSEDTDNGLAFVSGLAMYWMMDNLWLEGRNYCELFLALSEGQQSGHQAGALIGSAGLNLLIGDLKTGAARLTSGIEMAKAVNNRMALARGLSIAGMVAREQGKHEESIALQRQCMQLFDKSGNDGGCVFALAAIGHSLRRMQQHEEACIHLNDSLERSKSIGLIATVPYAQFNLGKSLTELGETDKATTQLEHAVENAAILGIGVYLVPSLMALGWIELQKQHYQAAQRHLVEGARMGHQLGQRKQVGRALHGIALCKAEDNDWSAVARLLSAADALGSTDKTMPRFTRTRLEVWRKILIGKLPVVQLTSEQTRGRSISVGKLLDEIG